MGKTVYYLDSTLTRDSTTIIGDSSLVVGDGADGGYLLWNLLFDIEGKRAISTISSHVGRVEGSADNGLRAVTSYMSRIEGGVERATKRVSTVTSFMGILKSDASRAGEGTRTAGSHVSALLTSVSRLVHVSRQVDSHIQPILTSTSRVGGAGREGYSYIQPIHTKATIHTEKRWYVLPHPVTAWETGWLYWTLEDDLSQEVFDFTKYVSDGGYLSIEDQVSLAWGPEEIGTPGDYSRLWVAYSEADQTIWLARTDETFTFWEERFQIVAAPTGATYPSLGFDPRGNYEIAVALTPAGSEQAEVWVIEWPYFSGTTQKIADGEFPSMQTLNTFDRAVFYQNALNPEEILYRLSSEDWETPHTLSLTSVGEVRALAYRGWAWEYSIHPLVNYTVHEGLLFWKEGEENLPRYIKSLPHVVQDPFIQGEEFSLLSSLESVDWVDRTFQITFHVFNALDSSPLEGATVSGQGQSGVTNEAGNVALPLVVGLAVVSFSVGHPNYVDLTDSFHTDEDTTILVGLLPIQEFFGEVQITSTLVGIEWQEVGFEEVPGEEHSNTIFQLNRVEIKSTNMLLEEPGEEIKISSTLESILWIEV